MKIIKQGKVSNQKRDILLHIQLIKSFISKRKHNLETKLFPQHNVIYNNV